MDKITENWKKYKELVFCIFLHWAGTFFTDKRIFAADSKSHLITYIFLKITLLIVVSFFWKFLYDAVAYNEGQERKIIGYSLPYLIFLLILFFRSYPMQLYSDELNIFNKVTEYQIFPYHFTYFTGSYFALCFMLIPVPMGPVLIKLLVQAFVCGYVVNRTKCRAAYLIFLLPPVIEFSTAIHRMQLYGLIYLLLAVKITFDYIEKKELNKRRLFIICILCGILAIWRKEGIYLVISAPTLIVSVYRIKDYRRIIKAAFCYYLILLLLAAPEIYSYQKGKFSVEASHSYNSFFVHMCRLGLDKNKYSEQMEKIDKVLSLDAVDYINRELGDENYKDEYIAWREGYIGIKDDYTLDQYHDYISSIQYLILHEPVLFLKTRLGSWNFTARNGVGVYKIGFDTVWQAFKTVAANLYIPFFIIAGTMVYTGIKRKWSFFILAGGIIVHTFITVLLSPAAYFKYYYHMYLIGYFWLFLIIWRYFYLKMNRKERNTNEKRGQF